MSVPIAPLPCHPRAGLLLTFRDPSDAAAVRAAIRSAVGAAQDALPEATVIGLVTLPLHDELFATLGGRVIGAPFDAVLEVVLPSGQSMSRLHAIVPALHACLVDKLDPAGCAVNVGEALYANRGQAPHAMVVQFHRDPRARAIDVMSWWTTDHIALTLTGAAMMGDYALQHRHDPVCDELSQALGFKDSADIFESVYIRDLTVWNRAIGIEAGRKGLADEVGRLSHVTMRGAYAEVVARADP